MTELTDDIKREIGQHFVFGFYGYDVSDDVRTLIKDYYVGSIIIMKRNVRSIPQLHSLIHKLQKIAKDEAKMERPLMIGIDQENGLVSAFSSTVLTPDAGTQFPGAMAQSSTQSSILSERIAEASGVEMKMAGINWVYSPVADVNIDPKNPVIGVRSFSDDPYIVSTFAKSVAKGLSRANIAPCAKHFPGHGDTHIDSHHGLPVIRKGIDELNSMELVPFKNLISIQDFAGIGGIASIMTGHMALPLLENEPYNANNEKIIPSSLSRNITTKILRDQMNFEGVIVTDCLEMSAISALPGGIESGAVSALQAGTDVVMICHTFARQLGAVEATYVAVQKGTIDLEKIKMSGQRIKGMKDKFTGTWEEVLSSGGVIDNVKLARVKEENEMLSKEAYNRAMAWLIPDVGRSYIPVRPQTDPREGNVLIFIPMMESINPAVDSVDPYVGTDEKAKESESHLYTLATDGKRVMRNTAGPSYLSFVESMRRRLGNGVKVDHVVYAPNDNCTEVMKSFNINIQNDKTTDISIIFVMRSADRSTWQLSYLRRLISEISIHYHQSNSSQLTQKKFKLALLSSNTPYDLISAQDISNTYPCLCTFEFTAKALDAASAVLCGDSIALGKMPVNVVFEDKL